MKLDLYTKSILTIIAVCLTINVLKDSQGAASLDWSSRNLLDANEDQSLSWNSRTLYSTTGNPSIDWAAGFFYDSTGNKSYNYDVRTLIYPDGSTTAINYGTQNQIGITGSVSISGSLNVQGNITQNGVDLNSLMIAYAIALG
jgi:hypothetical protein